MTTPSIPQQLAKELNLNLTDITKTITLFDEGATIPFIARYRKEVTGSMTDIQLRQLEGRLTYLRELHERRQTILNTIQAQGKLTPELEKALTTAQSKTDLEDLYLPYRPKRKTKADRAKKAGLKPLAKILWQPTLSQPLVKLVEDFRQQRLTQLEATSKELKEFTKEFGSHEHLLEGAREIIKEEIAEEALLLQKLRPLIWQKGELTSTIKRGKKVEGQTYTDYFDYQEPIKNIPSHRALALFRGEKEGYLRLSLTFSPEEISFFYRELEHYFINRTPHPWLHESLQLALTEKLLPSFERDAFTRLKEKAETEAIVVFAENLKHLLLAPPAGPKVIMGIDPGIRTGCKLAIINEMGGLLATDTLYPHAPRHQWEESQAKLKEYCQTYHVELIAVGNGTAARETEKLAREILPYVKESQPSLQVIQVSEAGASVYSASSLAAAEFPELDVSLRGAVSIARRLQDPLAELVKIEPKAIGVGQYQHDVNQKKLESALFSVVEDCVNAVGVEVNRASSSLLQYISGLTKGVAENIVQYRENHGPFKSRKDLSLVPRLGEKTFELAAGFLRIAEGTHPLDNSSVHPEAYKLVEAIAQQNQLTLAQLIGNEAVLNGLKAHDYRTSHFGLPTIRDVITELKKPGRDPRQTFKTATFKEGVTQISDLSLGMQLEGVITNVVNFGAFIDIGVGQDGLVHISELANRFVKDPHEVVKVGEIVTATVLEVDEKRKRVALSLKRCSS